MTAEVPDSFNRSLVESGSAARLTKLNRSGCETTGAGRGVQTLDRKVTLWETGYLAF